MKNFGRLYQIAIVVRSLQESIRHYASLLGVGSFVRMDTDYIARYRNRTGVSPIATHLPARATMCISK